MFFPVKELKELRVSPTIARATNDAEKLKIIDSDRN
jgi:hypothetical protein